VLSIFRSPALARCERMSRNLPLGRAAPYIIELIPPRLRAVPSNRRVAPGTLGLAYAYRQRIFQLDARSRRSDSRTKGNEAATAAFSAPTISTAESLPEQFLSSLILKRSSFSSSRQCPSERSLSPRPTAAPELWYGLLRVYAHEKQPMYPRRPYPCWQ